jgi:hypothetical protein
LAGAQRTAGELQTQLNDFEGRYSGLVSPGAQADKGPLRDWLLAELREAIKEAVRDFKASLQVRSMQKRLRGQRESLAAEFSSIRNQIEMLRNWPNRRPDKKDTLAAINGEAKRVLAHLTSFVEGGFLNIERLLADLALYEVDSKEQSKAKAELKQAHSLELSTIEEAFAANLFIVQELTNKANEIVRQPLPQSAPLDERNAAAEQLEIWRKNEEDIAKVRDQLSEIQARVKRAAASI